MKTIIYQTNHQANNDGSKKIHQVLREFTRQSMAPLKGGDKIEIIAQNKLDEFIGGIVGCFVWQWLEIDALVVIDAYREKGIGSTLLKKIEAEAKRQNIYKIRLNTFGFQLELAFCLLPDLDGLSE